MRSSPFGLRDGVCVLYKLGLWFFTDFGFLNKTGALYSTIELHLPKGFVYNTYTGRTRAAGMTAVFEKE